MSDKCAAYRYSLANVVIPHIPAGTTVEVEVILNGARPGDAGMACPVDAPLAGGLALNPVRISANNIGQIPFVNGTNRDITSVDTRDFVVHLLRAMGESIAPPAHT